MIGFLRAFWQARPCRALALTLLVAAFVAANPAMAAEPDHVDDETVGPFYDEHSKSYFELRFIRTDNKMWPGINAKVRTLSYKGARGRLAVITSPETHKFVENNILSKAGGYTNDVWIGLRVFCNGFKQLWSDGRVSKRKDFSVWYRQWYRHHHISCLSKKLDYMPVYYRRSNSGWRWQASGPQKGFVHAIVEYPTGKP